MNEYGMRFWLSTGAVLLVGLGASVFVANADHPSTVEISDPSYLVSLAFLQSAESELGLLLHQREVWRELIHASESLAEAMRPLPRFGRDGSLQALPEPLEEVSLNDLPAVRRLEAMIERSRDLTLAGLRLRQAIDRLSDVLTSEQVEIADDLLFRHVSHLESDRPTR